MSILIVEDDDEIRELLAEMLTDKGYSALTAADGEKALAVLRGGPPPCLVVLDLMMPKMDGWAFRAALLADPAFAKIPVVVLSGAADLRDGTAGLQAARVLTKPIKWQTFLDVVREHCPLES
jgi:CheY-like chemotaxis protein